MYNLIIYLYQLGVAFYSLFNKKVRLMWRGERQAFSVLRQKVEPGARYVWFHAASLGEFEQGRPLMEQLRRQRPELKILLTFFSPSGYEVRKNYSGADIVCYLPLDTPTNARRFLRLVRPEKAFFIKYEFWYNYLHILKHRQVPVYSVSSIFRPDQVFFKWYGRQYRRVLSCFTHFYVQNEQSRQLLSRLGIACVSIVGDTRFDRVLSIRDQARQLPVVEAFVSQATAPPTAPEGASCALLSGVQGFVPPSGGEGGAVAVSFPIFVAGSSWPPDEEIFIRYFLDHPQWKLIIAPHVIDEAHLSQIEAMLANRRVVRYTAATDSADSLATADVLIIDCFGLLSTIYRYATVAYVGGGFGVSIHNTVEAAVWGVPVVFGPNNHKFQEAQELKACGAGLEIGGYDDFQRILDRLASDHDFLARSGQAAANYVKGKAGATDKILSEVF